jgi:hypothetical protein
MSGAGATDEPRAEVASVDAPAELDDTPAEPVASDSSQPGPGEPGSVPRLDPFSARPTIDPAAVTSLARLHLRVGLYALARSELEALRMLASLDEDGLEALAEARWRTGDLAAAGTLAVPLAEAGTDRPIVLVIAAESVAAQGRPGEAGALVARAVETMDGSLDTLFSGLPRHASWPVAAFDAARGAEPVPAPIGGDGAGAAPSAAAEAYAGGRAALAAGDAARAALEMGIALRLDPGFAGAVLDVIGTRATDPGLVLVAGDALRILGREQEALAAFDVARGTAALVADAAGAAGASGLPSGSGASEAANEPATGDAGDRPGAGPGDDPAVEDRPSEDPMAGDDPAMDDGSMDDPPTVGGVA